MITLEQGIEAARVAEVALSHCLYHVALGGSLLHKGTSEKDIDLFCYPHTTLITQEAPRILSELQKVGFTIFERRDHDEHDDKVVYRTEYNNQRVDIFILD